VEVIRLNGSVELAPVLGLAPYIVDLVETGSTLKANDLVVRKELESISVHLIANPAYYKFHYRRVNDFLKRLQAPPEE
jgi:ATP phosphoribosyltransferase